MELLMVSMKHSAGHEKLATGYAHFGTFIAAHGDGVHPGHIDMLN